MELIVLQILSALDGPVDLVQPGGVDDLAVQGYVDAFSRMVFLQPDGSNVGEGILLLLDDPRE